MSFKLSVFHSRCETLNLQEIKPGTVSTDAECGEQTGDRKAVVVSVVVVLVMIMIVAALVLLFYGKKKGCLNTGMIWTCF